MTNKRAWLLRSLAFAAALAVSHAQAAGDIVAQRGAVTITTDDVRQILAALDAPSQERLQHDPAALGALVRERLVQLVLLQEARDKKWDQRPEVATAATQAHDAVIVNSYLASVSAPEPGYPADSDIQAAYEANAARLMAPKQFQLAQIFVASAGGDDGKKKAEELRAQAAKPKADFAALARQNSQDRATADKGGELGWVREDQVAPEIRAAVAGLPDGSVSEPVRMADGWHVVKLVGSRPAAPAPLAEVKAKLAEALRTQRAQQNAQAYVATELRAQPAQIDEIALGKLAGK